MAKNKIKLKFQCGSDLQFKDALAELEKLGYFIRDNIGLDVVIYHYHKGLIVNKEGNKAFIGWKNKSDFFFGLSLLIANYDEENYFYEAQARVERLYGQTDCSRNAVRKVSTLKEYIRVLALSGYNGLYLYLENTYKIKEEPYFGYMRGAYTSDEIKEVVDYAQIFGMEVIPSVQFLAHLTSMLRWDIYYYDYADTPDILLADEEKVYALIEKMVKTLREGFITNKINLGMDEAHYIGLGAYLDKHGYTEKRTIMLKHIKQVCKICKKYGFDKPQMWSDMIFKMSKNLENLSEHERKEYSEYLDSGIQLIYWEYYNTGAEDYDKYMNSLAQISDNIAFCGGGGFTWFGYAPCNYFSNPVNRTTFKCCVKNNINYVIIAEWYDSGAEGSCFSGLNAMMYAGCLKYSENPEESILNAISCVATGYDFNTWQALDYPNITYEDDETPRLSSSHKYLLYGDMIGNLFEKHMNEKFVGYYKRAIDKLSVAERGGRFRYVFDTLQNLCYVLEEKVDITLKIKKAYDSQDKALMKEMVNRFPLLIEKIQKFYDSVIYQWEKENKNQGVEVIDLRLGGLMQRIKHIEKVLNRYITGEIETIDELDEEKLKYLVRAGYDYDPNDDEMCNMTAFCYHELTTAGGII